MSQSSAWTAYVMLSTAALVAIVVAQPYQTVSKSSASRCLDLGEFPQYETVCAQKAAAGVCGVTDGTDFTSPCSQGNGDCRKSNGDFGCASCGGSASTFIPYIYGSSNPYGTDCQPPKAGTEGSNLYTIFQVAPFVIASPNALEGEMIVPLLAKTDAVDLNSINRTSVAGNDFSDTFERSVPVTANRDAPDVVFSANLYYSAFVVDAVDSTSYNQSIVFNGQLSKSIAQLTAGVGLVLWQPTIPRSTFGSPITPFYSIDPLGPVSSFHNAAIGGESFLSRSNRLGALNFTSSLTEAVRYMAVNDGSPMLQLKLGPNGFRGSGVSLALHPKNIFRTVNSLHTSIALTTTIPATLDDFLRLPQERLSSETSTTEAKVRGAQSSNALFGGQFPRLSSFTIGNSRRVSSTLLHKSWNVFAAGSHDRNVSFMTSPLATATVDGGRNVLVPFSLFRDDSERRKVLDRVGSPLSEFFFELVYPIKIQVLPTVAKVIHWSDGSFDIFRLSLDDSLSMDGIGPTPVLKDPDPFAVFVQFYNSTFPNATCVIASHQRMDGAWVSVVYRPGTNYVVYFGPNTYGQFGRGASNQTIVFPIISPPYDFGHAVAQVELGETHCVVRSMDGRLFFAGRVPANQSIDCGQPKLVDTTASLFQELLVFANGSAVLDAIQNGSGVVNATGYNVTWIAAGYGYTSIALTLMTPSRNNNTCNATCAALCDTTSNCGTLCAAMGCTSLSATCVASCVAQRSSNTTCSNLCPSLCGSPCLNTTNHVLLCGASYLTGNARGAVTEITSKTSTTWNTDYAFDRLHSGRYHFCATHRASSGRQTVVCLGSLDISNETFRWDPNISAPLWSSRTGGKVSSSFSVANVETFSSGFHHVAITMMEGDHTEPIGNTSAFKAFRSVLVSGSNGYGQLGAAMRSTATAANGLAHPRFTFPERLSSTRGPNVYLTLNKELTDVTPADNYQLFETVAANAVYNTTYVFQRSRVFNNPNTFMQNYSKAARHAPPDGKYALTTIFADAVPEWNPFNREQKFSMRTLNVTDLIWDVRFGVIKGLALFLVQNQTVGDGRWAVPPTTNEDEKDCTLGKVEGFNSYVQGNTFYRDWKILRRNITRSQSTKPFNATHNVTETLQTIMIPSVFFLSSNGSVYPLTRLQKGCAGRSDIWCNPVTREILCNWNEPAAPVSYSNVLNAGSGRPWLAMFVSVEAVNVTTHGVALFNATTSTVNWTTSTPLTSVDTQLVVAIGQQKFVDRNSYWFCTPKRNLYDCSSLVYYQAFFPTRKSPSSFFAFSTGGLHHDELPLGGFTGLLRLTLPTSWRRISNQCVFLKLGRFYYYIQLVDASTASSGTILICSRFGLSRYTGSRSVTITVTRNTTNAPLAPAAPNPAVAPPTPAPFNVVPEIQYLRWESTPSSNTVILRTIDRENNLIPLLRYTNRTPNYNLDPYNLSMRLGAHGAVAQGFDGNKEPTAYMLFSNESVEAVLQEQAVLSPGVGIMSSAANFFVSPDASYGTYHLPIIPMVRTYNVFAVWVQSDAQLRDGDAIVLRLRSSGQETTSSGLQFSIGPNGTTLERIDDATRVRYASRRFYQSLCVIVRDSTTLYARVLADSSQFYCTPRPMIPTWTRISMQRDFTGLISVFLDSDLVGMGRIAEMAQLFRDVVALEISLRNRMQPITYGVDVREVVFCNDGMGVGISNGISPFPCAVNSKPLNAYHVSSSNSHSTTVTASDSSSSEVSLTTTPTDDHSASVSKSSSATVSASKEVSESASASFSSTTTNESISITIAVTHTHSKTGTIRKNVSIIPVELNLPSLTSYNIRKTGVPIVVYLAEDEFHPRANWATSPNAYVQCTSNVPFAKNPSSFCASFGKKGFATATVRSSNRSILEMTFGPANFYNSYGDEDVSLRFLSSAAASEFTVPGYVNFTVSGVGYRITTNLRRVEGAGALLSVAGLLLGGPASNVLRIATNSIFLNFHCFNDEDYPLSWLMSPTTVKIDGSTKLGVAVVNFSLIIGVVGVHLAVVCAVYFIRKDTLLKAQGEVYFPGLSFGLSAILLPGYISGAWQGAVESESSGYVVLVVLVMVIVVLFPMLFLIRTLYDAAYFTATFVPFPPEVLKSFVQDFPVMSRVIPPGAWRSTDRHYSFVRRFHHIIWEFRDTMQHWFCLELAETVFVGSVGAITNSSPVACIAQLCCFVTVKVCMLVALVMMRPHSTPVGQWPATFISAAQIVSLLFVLIDAYKGGTNAYQSAYTATLFVIAMLLTAHSLLTVTILVNYRWLKFKERKLMRDVAHMYHSSGRPDSPSARAAGTRSESPTRLADIASKYPCTTTYLPSGTMVKVVDVPMKVLLLEEGDTDDEGTRPNNGDSVAIESHDNGSSNELRRSQVGSSFTLVEHISNHAVGHQMANRNFGTAEERNFWRIAAMESLTGEPATNIPLDPDAHLL